MIQRRRKASGRGPFQAGPRLLVDSPSGHIASIIRHTRQLEYLTRCLHQCLDPAAATHCVVANSIGGQLVILADSPVWASRLRYMAPTIAGQMSACLPDALEPDIRIIVHPRDPSPAPARVHPNALSENSAASIRETAETLEDGKLKASLLRLAARAGRRKV